MGNRSLLRTQIREAFVQSLEIDYYRQRINSERSLQASLWANLNTALPERSRRMFIEPAMSLGGSKSFIRYPDLVVCNTKEIIGIVELKYLPRGRPKWEKDLATFEWVHTNQENIEISNQRFRGVDVDTKNYTVSKNVLYVWAGIHAPRDEDIYAAVSPKISSQFLALQAITTTGKSAKILSNRNRVLTKR